MSSLTLGDWFNVATLAVNLLILGMVLGRCR